MTESSRSPAPDPDFPSSNRQIEVDVLCAAAAIRKRTNEESSPIYQLSNDPLIYCLGFVGAGQYRNVAGTSVRFRDAYLDKFGNNNKKTSIHDAAKSLSFAKLFTAEADNLEHHLYDLFTKAACNNKLEILEWAQGSSWELNKILDEETMSKVAGNGHLAVIQFLKKIGIPWCSKTCAEAAYNGNLEVLVWAREHQCPWDEWTCTKASFNGNLEVLKWAHEHQCPWNELTCTYAALNDNLEVLKWARKRRCPWDKSTCTYAAYNGNLEVLKWAGKHQCPWDSQTCGFAAKNGNLEMLKWAREHKCPWDEETYHFAEQNGDSVMMRYLDEHACPRYT